MLLVCTIDVLDLFDKPELLINTEREIVIFHGTAPLNRTNLFPVRVFSENQDLQNILYATIKSCMRQFCPNKVSTPWKRVEERLQDFKIFPNAILYPDPVRMDIVL